MTRAQDRTCSGKVKHFSQSAAELHLAGLKSSGSPSTASLRVYRCACGWWHVGHGKRKDSELAQKERQERYRENGWRL